MLGESDFIRLRPRKSLFINVTSLIDVLFLLLIFFAVTSTFEKTAALKVSLPSAKGEAVPKAPTVLEVLVSKESLVFLNGSRVAVENLTRAVKDAAAASKEAPPSLHFKVDKAVPYGFAVKVMSAIKESGIQSILAITQTDEPPLETPPAP